MAQDCSSRRRPLRKIRTRRLPVARVGVADAVINKLLDDSLRLGASNVLLARLEVIHRSNPALVEEVCKYLEVVECQALARGEGPGSGLMGLLVFIATYQALVSQYEIEALDRSIGPPVEVESP